MPGGYIGPAIHTPPLLPETWQQRQHAVKARFI
jgi:hypothetical protein